MLPVRYCFDFGSGEPPGLLSPAKLKIQERRARVPRTNGVPTLGSVVILCIPIQLAAKSNHDPQKPKTLFPEKVGEHAGGQN